MGAEAALFAMARKQCLVFTHEQAVASGLSSRTISRRVASGDWVRLFRAVYASAAVTIGWQQLAMGACMVCGPLAVGSHSSAELIWEFASVLDIPHVTVPATQFRKHDGIVVHRSQTQDAVGRNGFRVTHPMRTLLDLAPCRPEEVIERYVDDAHRRGLIAVRRFTTYLEEPTNVRKPQAALLRELLSYRDPEAPIDSDLETIFFRVLREAGLPIPVPQHAVMTLEGERFIDFAYPDAGLAIEVDGYAQRANRAAFNADRARQNDIEELGWAFRRFTWDQVRDEPAGVACKVGLALGLRPVRWKSASPNGGPGALRRAPVRRSTRPVSAVAPPPRTHRRA